MALNIDTSRALRTPDQLRALVSAVYEAAPEDESRSIEWKSTYENLISPEASFAVGRAILGLANRAVTVAGAAFEGVGYVLVGVEPGTMHGQQVPDSAELFNAVHRYTGPGWPYWDARTVTIDGVTILVIIVEPPRNGDRIALLHRGYQSRASKSPLVPDGTVFVRQVGATERASRNDLEMLQERLLSGSDAEAAASREADRRRDLRELVAELVHAGDRWADTMQILVLSSAGGQWTESDWVEWVNTDSGREMTGNAQTVKRNSRKIRLSTDEQSLVDPVVRILERFGTGNVFDFMHRSGPTNADDRHAAYQQINALKSALRTLEENAIHALSNRLQG